MSLGLTIASTVSVSADGTTSTKGWPAETDEPTFEALLWERIQSLSDKDSWLGQRADPRVSEDPDNPHFSLSFGGEAFFCVGLHPGASRPAQDRSSPGVRARDWTHG